MGFVKPFYPDGEQIFMHCRYLSGFVLELHHVSPMLSFVLIVCNSAQFACMVASTDPGSND